MNNRRSILFTWMVCEFLNKVAGSLDTVSNGYNFKLGPVYDQSQGFTTAVGELYNGSAIELKHNAYIRAATRAAAAATGINGAADRSGTVAGSDTGFAAAFIESLSVTLVTELGDNTFFTAAILAMQHPRIIVFFGALTALTVMNALSVSLALVLTIIPKVFTYYASTGMLLFFGTKMIRDAYNMSPDAENGFDAMATDMEEKKKKQSSSCSDGLNLAGRGMDTLMMVFTTVLLAEFGDRSQLTTFVMSAQKNALGIIVGGTVGRCFSTGAAVIGGRMIAQRVSVRTVTAVGGILFLLFAFSSSMPNEKNLGLVAA